ncbi:ribonuclease P/MRP protein subunit [Gaertneriomyces semiglobifer]|nr:ribonuclease P/MRP protein subunit [Gaertneriomyces semiglobifer]
MVRFKNRYLLFQIHYDLPSSLSQFNIDPSIHGGNINSCLKDSIDANFGDYGAGLSAASVTVKYFSPYTSTGIIRCARDNTHVVWAALTFITKLKGRPCCFRVVHVGGTIKCVQREAISLDAKILEGMRDIPRTY